jgi:hypothetical protein
VADVTVKVAVVVRSMKATNLVTVRVTLAQAMGVFAPVVVVASTDLTVIAALAPPFGQATNAAAVRAAVAAVAALLVLVKLVPVFVVTVIVVAGGRPAFLARSITAAGVT